MYIHIMPLEQIKKFVADRFEETLLNKPNAVLGMTTGKTPITVGLFEELIRRENAGEIDFSKSVMVNPDEQDQHCSGTS
jgi:glucosamine-6-phosphate deaminase